MRNSTLIKLKSYGFEGGGKAVSNQQLNLYINQLNELLQKYFSKEYLENNFSIPTSYLDFSKDISTFLYFGKYHTIYSLKEVVEGTRNTLFDFECNFYNRSKSNQQFKDNDVIWLAIGWWSDKHDLLICCDKSSVFYGKIYDVWDDHPWYSEKFVIAEEFENIEAYANYLLDIKTLNIDTVFNENY